MNIIENAKKIAYTAHEGTNRKWSVAPYIVHPERCAEMAKNRGYSDVIQAAMYSHDILEDCGEQWAENIENECGNEVLALVRELTFPTEGKEWEGRPRAEKNVIREAQMRKMSKEAKICKMLDSIDNYGDMERAPRRLIHKTIDDGWRRLDILKDADPELAKIMKAAIEKMEKLVRS